MRSAQLSFTDYRKRTGRGGPRPGAGRPRGPRPRVLHREREAVPGSCPVHVTLRVRPGVASLRGGALVREWRRSLAEASERGSFRVAHYSLQGDHAHLIVEAQGKEALACGMKSIGARLARAVNRVSGRSGPGARRPLSPPQPALAARGAAGSRLRAAERTAAPREEPRSLALCHGAPRRRELRALVRRLAAGGCQPHSGGPNPARGGAPAHLAAVRRVETSRTRGPRRDPRLADAAVERSPPSKAASNLLVTNAPGRDETARGRRHRRSEPPAPDRSR